MLSADFTLAAERQAIGAIRHRLAENLIGIGVHLGENDTFTIKLLFAELATNAIVHGCGGDRSDLLLPVELTVTAAHLRVAVTDPSNTRPQAREAGYDDTTGRGLQLVSEMADAHGVDMLDTGKRVWAEFELTDSFLVPQAAVDAATVTGEGVTTFIASARANAVARRLRPRPMVRGLPRSWTLGHRIPAA
ncbi:ATP-binding protein [Kitasatospora sp. NPDC087315]|uniref:ATP-binding protein n=1 Tax=Kitasatospora sp. NPDC087315 TaxID=3364069 RepID=UPI0038175F73